MMVIAVLVRQKWSVAEFLNQNSLTSPNRQLWIHKLDQIWFWLGDLYCGLQEHGDLWLAAIGTVYIKGISVNKSNHIKFEYDIKTSSNS